MPIDGFVNFLSYFSLFCIYLLCNVLSKLFKINVNKFCFRICKTCRNLTFVLNVKNRLLENLLATNINYSVIAKLQNLKLGLRLISRFNAHFARTK